MKNNSVSFIIVVRNDIFGFSETFNSIINEVKCEDKLCIVDGSDTSEIIDFIKNQKDIGGLTISIHQDQKKGVFAAQNMGIKNSENWICVINSGDILVNGARIQIEKAILTNPSVQCHVFSQYAFDKKGFGYRFTPKFDTLWPHQSILLHKNIYNRFGLYRTDFKYSAEQYFFAIIRKKIPYKIHNQILTNYLLGGLSSKVNFRHCIEQFRVRRELGKPFFLAIWLSLVSPTLRLITELVLGRRLATKIKLAIKKNYSSN